jgi:outer membrane biogenesis lipoprotein LolB|tara:strand:+ start:333 stop:560 length:228 start_codon:yes stop_codon:yes gene_type:complete
MKATLPILAATAALLFSSCASNGSTAGKGTSAQKQGGSDHEPQIDFWQNGGGACCAYHAQQHQAKTLGKNKQKRS